MDSRRNLYYDTTEFSNRWHSPETIESIAHDLDVNPDSVRRAAKRRGFANKVAVRGPIKYKERTK